MNTPDAFTVPVSDTVLGYILAFARRQPWMDTAMKAGVWDKIPGRTLHECTLGIIGVGRIGKAIALTYVREGAKVVNFSFDEPDYENESVEFYKGDVTDREGVKAFFDHVVEKYGKIDILVNNAGITRDALIHKMSEDMWDFVIDVNLKGVFNLVQLVGPKMMEQGAGSIVNISSVVGEYGNVGQTNYAATKAGVIAMAKTWAKEFSRKGAAVRVNAIAPGYMATDNTAPLRADAERSAAILERIPAGRWGQPDDLKGATVFLASAASDYLHGATINVDGGWLAR